MPVLWGLCQFGHESSETVAGSVRRARRLPLDGKTILTIRKKDSAVARTNILRTMKLAFTEKAEGLQSPERRTGTKRTRYPQNPQQ